MLLNSFDTQLPKEKWDYLERYKQDFHATHRLVDVDLSETNVELELCGRLIRKRCFKAVAFGDLYEDGRIVQLAISISESDTFLFFKSRVKVGDYIGIYGLSGLSNNESPVVFATQMSLLSCAARQIPDKHKGVLNSQTKRHARYLDLIGNPSNYAVFKRRSAIIQSFRSVLLSNGYLEMDTPVLSTEQCGSNARQFQTHHNDLDCTVYLRVSAELALKQLVMSGFGRVFEFCRNFRNEGTDKFHRQEFLNLELFCTYSSLPELKELTIEMINSCLQEDQLAVTTNSIPTYNVYDLILENYNIDILNYESLEHLKELMLRNGVITAQEIDELVNANACVNRMVGKLVKQQGFHFLRSYPAELYPLCRSCSAEPRIAEMEYLNYGHLNVAQFCAEESDPVRLSHTLEQQASVSWKKNDVDNTFLHAISYGLPPMAGVGISMERMIMILNNKDSMYDVNFFHLTRNKE